MEFLGEIFVGVSLLVRTLLEAKVKNQYLRDILHVLIIIALVAVVIGLFVVGIRIYQIIVNK